MSAAIEIAAAAARLVVEEGMEYGPAKRKAARLLGDARASLPDNDVVEDEVRAYLALYCADTQPAELAALRRLALRWMEKLAAFRPHLSGAVWRGTATRLNEVHLQLYCDDPKSAEIELINQGLRYEVASLPGVRGQEVDALVLHVPCPELGETVPLRLSLLDHDDLRGALKPDARGRSARGDLAGLQRLLSEDEAKS